MRNDKLSETLCNPYPQTPIFTRAKSGTPLMGGGERTGYSYQAVSQTATVGIPVWRGGGGGGFPAAVVVKKEEVSGSI